VSEPITNSDPDAPVPTPAAPKPKRQRRAAVVDVSTHLPGIHAAAAKAGVSAVDATAQFRGLIEGALAQAAATLIAAFLQQAQAAIAAELASAQAQATHGAGEVAGA